MKISIVIPTFNEEEKIFYLLKDLKKFELPIIVVDDGSKTDCYKKLSKVKGITLLTHKINLGKGSALKTGCEYAFKKGIDAVILMDADGQHEAKDLARFLDALRDGNEIVLGSRNLNLGVPFVRYIGNKFASVLISFLFGIYVSDILCGFRAFTKKAYRKIKWDSQGYGVETEMVVRMSKFNLKYCEVPVGTVYYSSVKGVTIIDALGILIDVFKWRINL